MLLEKIGTTFTIRKQKERDGDNRDRKVFTCVSTEKGFDSWGEKKR